MSALREVAAGYLLIHPVQRPAYASSSLLPAEILSASDCVCPQFPDTSAIDWVISSEEARLEALDAAGVTEHRRAEARAWATAQFEVDFGWPGVFYTVSAAMEIRNRFFERDSNVRVIGLGLPVRYLEEFIAYASPPEPSPGFAPQGDSGYLRNVRAGQPLAAGGQHLGFELVNVEVGQLSHSWICNGLEIHCADNLGIQPNTSGLLETLESAERCRGEISREEVGAEPGLWLPWLLVDYS